MKFEEVTKDLILKKMQEHNKKQIELCDELNITKSEMSRYLSGASELSNRTKAAFFYYFKSLDLSKK